MNLLVFFMELLLTSPDDNQKTSLLSQYSFSFVEGVPPEFTLLYLKFYKFSFYLSFIAHHIFFLHLA